MTTEYVSRNISLDSGPSSYYPSAFKIGLVYFSKVQGLQETANLFRIPKEVLEDWFLLQDQILEQCRKDNFPDWERDLFVDVIMELANKETILLKDVIEKRKLLQPHTMKCENTNHMKWAIDWCKQFRFQLDCNQNIDEYSSLKLSGSSKFSSEAEKYGYNFERKSTPSYKMQVLQYAETHSVEECAKKYQMKMSTVRRWFSEKAILARLTEKSPSKAKIQTTQLRHEALENELFQWYQSMTRKGKTTRQSLIISKARSLARKLNLTSFDPSLKWYQEWFQCYVCPQMDLSSKNLELIPEDMLLLKDEWNKLLEKTTVTRTSRTGRLSLKACTQSSPNIKVTLISNTTLPVNESEVSNQVSTVDSGLKDDIGDQRSTKLSPSNIAPFDSRRVIGDDEKATPLTLVEAAFEAQTINEKISKENSNVPMNDGSTKPVTETLGSNISLSSSEDVNSKCGLNPSHPNLTGTLDSQLNSNVLCVSTNDNDTILPKLVEFGSIVEQPAEKLDGVVGATCVKSRSSSRNASDSSSSSVYSSCDSNSNSCSDPELRQSSLSGSFQQIFLKFAKAGKQPINDQTSLMGLPDQEDSSSSGCQSNDSSKPSVSKPKVQSNYILRKKTPVVIKNKVRKPTFVKASRLSPVQFIPPQILKNKVTTISRRLGYSSAAGSLKNPNLFHKQNGKQVLGKGRGRHKKQKNAWKISSKAEEPKKVATEKDETKLEETEPAEEEALAYPACFQNRVIESSEIKGMEAACEEFGLQSSVVADWIHSKNSIKMLCKVENFQEWELDLYVSVHKQTMKGQRISMSQLLSKGLSILSALNLSDCNKFESENAVDWCERFGIVLSDESSTQMTTGENASNTLHHRQKYSNEFMIEVCNYIKQNSSIKAHKKYDIPLSTLRTWIVKDIISKRKNLHGNSKKYKLKGTGVKIKESPKKSEPPATSETKISHDDVCASKSTEEENSTPMSKRKHTSPGLQNKSEKDSSKIQDNVFTSRPKILSEEARPKRHVKEKGKSPKEEESMPSTSDPHVLLTPLKGKNADDMKQKKNLRYTRKYSEEFVLQVLEYSRKYGTSQASRHFKISSSVIRHYGGPMVTVGGGTGLGKFSPAIKAQALEYADKFSSSEAAKKFSVSVSLLGSWRCQRRYNELMKQMQKDKSSVQSSAKNVNIEKPKSLRIKKKAGRPKKTELTTPSKTTDSVKISKSPQLKTNRSETSLGQSEVVKKHIKDTGELEKGNYECWCVCCKKGFYSLKQLVKHTKDMEEKSPKNLENNETEERKALDKGTGNLATETLERGIKRKPDTMIDFGIEQKSKVPKPTDSTTSNKLKATVSKLSQEVLDEYASQGLITNSPKHSARFIHQVVAYANVHSVIKSCDKYNVKYQLVRDWIQQYAIAWKRKKRTSWLEGHQLPQKFLDNYASEGLIKNSPNYSALLIHEIVCYTNNNGLSKGCLKYKVNRHDLHNWLKRYSNKLKNPQPTKSISSSSGKHSQEFISRVVKYSLKHNGTTACKRFSVPKSTLQRWMQKTKLSSSNLSPEKTLPAKQTSPKKVSSEDERMEKFEKEVLNWCKLLQMNDNSVRAAKVIMKARHIAQQLNMDDAFISQEWYKKWSFKNLQSVFKTHTSEIQEKTDSSLEQTLKIPAAKKPKLSDKTPSEKIAKELKGKSSIGRMARGEKFPPTLDIKIDSVTDNTKAKETPRQNETKDNVKAKEIVPEVEKSSPHRSDSSDVYHYSDRNDIPNSSPCVDYDPNNGKVDMHNKEVFDIGRALVHQKGLQSAVVRDDDCESYSSRSIQSDANPSGTNLKDRSSRASARLSFPKIQIKGNEKKSESPSVGRKEESTMVLVITDPGVVFYSWLKEVNKTEKTITPLSVKKKLEFIVKNTDEDFFDNWLFRLYDSFVKQVNHPKMASEMLQTVLGLDGYVPANVKLEMLKYAERKSTKVVSDCFQISEKKLTEWKKAEVFLKKIVRIADLFITSNKNIHIDLDIYEWYLKKVSEGSNEVKEEELRSKAQEVYHAHGGKVLKRWFKYFLERFQKVNALDSIEIDILEKILGYYDCNINPSAQEIMSVYEKIVTERNIQSMFLTSELWFKQFCDRYSDYLMTEFKLGDVLPGSLMKRCEEFRHSVYALEDGLGLNYIGSMEEIPFSFSSSSSSVASGPFRSCGFTNADGVVLLACLANGVVLSPFVIFNKNSPQTGEVEITDPVLSQWLNKVWLTQVSQNKSLLILDSFSAHQSAKFSQNAESANVRVALVPPGCNCAVHPIVLGISARFQHLLRDVWTRRFPDPSKELVRSDMVSLVNDAYSEIFQEAEFVRRSFQVTGMIQTDKTLIGNERYLLDSFV